MASFERIKTKHDMLSIINVDNVVDMHIETDSNEVVVYCTAGKQSIYVFDTPENAREWVMKILKDY